MDSQFLPKNHSDSAQFLNELSGRAAVIDTLDDTKDRPPTEKLRMLLNSKDRYDKKIAFQYLKEGADPNIQDQDGNTLLHHLIQSDAEIKKICELIHQYKATIEIKNHQGKTAIECMRDGTYGKFKRDREDKIIELVSNTYNNSGGKYYQEKNLTKAIEFFKKAIKINSGFLMGYSNLAICYLEIGMIDDALQTAQYVINNLDKNHEPVCSALGRIYTQLKQYELAIQYFNKAIELKNPRAKNLYLNLGNAYFEMGNYEQAVTAYENQIEQTPKQAEAYIKRGNAYKKLAKHDLAMQDYQQAMQNYQQALTINPDEDIAPLNEFLNSDELSMVSKPALIDTIVKIPGEDKRNSLLEKCNDENTPLGERMHQPEGLLAKAMCLFGYNPQDYEITRCDKSKGNLKRVNDLLGNDGKEQADADNLKCELSLAEENRKPENDAVSREDQIFGL